MSFFFFRLCSTLSECLYAMLCMCVRCVCFYGGNCVYVCVDNFHWSCEKKYVDLICLVVCLFVDVYLCICARASVYVFTYNVTLWLYMWLGVGSQHDDVTVFSCRLILLNYYRKWRSRVCAYYSISAVECMGGLPWECVNLCARVYVFMYVIGYFSCNF